MSDAVTRARELLDKATPWPWEERRHHFVDGEWMESSVVPVEDGDFREEDGDCVWINSCTADAELIAAAPTLLAELADEVERLTPVCSGCYYEPEAECPVHGYSHAELWAEVKRLTSANGDLSEDACVCVGGEWDLTCPVHTDGEDVVSASERISVLTDEVERLRALTTVDDAMVERSSLALHHITCDTAYHECVLDQSVGCRAVARAALEAALGVES